MVDVVEEARDVKQDGGTDETTCVGSVDVMLEAEARVNCGRGIPSSELGGGN